MYVSALPSVARDEYVAEALAEAGLEPDVRDLQFLPREDCLGVRLPSDRMLWFPSNENGFAALARERRVLRLLEARCEFAAPRVLYESESGWDLRALVPGVVDPVAVHARIQSDAKFAYALGEDLGRVLAEQHTRVPRAELAGWLPVAPSWPNPEDLLHLPDVVEDARLLARIDAALQRYESELRVLSDPVLVHADLGPHNIALNPASDRVTGVFDYRGAAFGDRHHDFTYMVFQTPEEPMLDGALAVYEPATGIHIDRERVRLFNAVSAIGFLGFRHGHAPEEAWCGRTLAEDLAWTNAALGLVGIRG